MMLNFFNSLDNVVWGAPLLILLVGTGFYFTVRLGLLQVTRLPKAFRLIFADDKGQGDISSFAALATALAATVGTGNIVELQPLSNQVVQGHYFGCGLLLSLEWRPSTLRDF